jgi:hypothetical protein
MVNYLKKIFQSTDKKILWLLVAIVLFQTIDGLLTQYLVPSGLFFETNTLLAPYIGRPGFIIVKALGAFIGAVLLWDINRRHPKLGLIAIWIVVIASGVIVEWNLFNLTLLI